MAQHATIDAAGNATGFFDDRVHKKIPAGAVALTPDQYTQWCTSHKNLVWNSANSTLVAAPATAPIVPKRVTRYQLKAHLLSMPGSTTGHTLLDDVAAWAVGEGGLTLLDWTDGTHFQRAGKTVEAAAQHFGWSAAQLDSMFTAAAAITA
jgi:hypothetical protein